MTDHAVPVLVLAGGLGTRLGQLAADVPKALVPLLGRPFVEHQLRALRLAGATDVVLCVGHLGDQIEAAVATATPPGLRVRLINDGPTLLGTAGATRKALHAIAAPLALVTYGDTILPVEHAGLLAAHRASRLPATMTVLHNQDVLDTSNAIVEDGRVTAYGKRPRPPGAEWIDYGLVALERDAIAGGERDLADVLSRLAAAGELGAYPVTEPFREIGTPESLAATEAWLRGAGPAALTPRRSA